MYRKPAPADWGYKAQVSRIKELGEDWILRLQGLSYHVLTTRYRCVVIRRGQEIVRCGCMREVETVRQFSRNYLKPKFSRHSDLIGVQFRLPFII